MKVIRLTEQQLENKIKEVVNEQHQSQQLVNNIKFIQQVVGVPADGQMGPQTINAIYRFVIKMDPQAKQVQSWKGKPIQPFKE